MKYSRIDKKLKEGYSLHAFRSGGGLRVLSLKKDNQKFYAESCDLYDALRILEDDIKAGGRKYKDVYGKIESDYLTGSVHFGDDLDNWICAGYPFDVKCEDDLIVIDISTKEDARVPESISKRVYKGESIYWKITGFKRMFKSTPVRYANDEIEGCSTISIPSRSGAQYIDERLDFIRIIKEKTFYEALEKIEDIVKNKFEFEWYEIPYQIGKDKEELLKNMKKYNL